MNTLTNTPTDQRREADSQRAAPRTMSATPAIPAIPAIPAMRPLSAREPRLLALARAGLTRIGARMTPSAMYWMERVMSQLEVGRWFRERGFDPSPLYTDRGALYTTLAREFAAERVLYLEFGVYRGESLRAWGQLLTNPASQLHGFDAFAGLPETWNHYNPRGKFDTNGQAPVFDDPRIALHIGWFQDTLPGFCLPPHERLVIHCDADLYSSTAFVLTTLKDAMRPGDILVFDEFYDRQHELRAFSEFLDASGMTFRFLGGATHLSQTAFQRIS